MFLGEGGDIISLSIDRQEIIDAILSGLDAGAWTARCVSLTADGESLGRRLAADIGRGVRTPEALERGLARLPLYGALDTVKIDTSGKTPEAVCGEIARLGTCV